MNTLYPVFLNLNKLRTLIVGGGDKGHEKLHYILKNSPDAKVTLVAPHINDEIIALAVDQNAHITLHNRAFTQIDIEKADVIIVTVDDFLTKKKISRIAKVFGKFIHVVNNAEFSNFEIGAVISKGDLKIAVFSKSPSSILVNRIKKVLEEAKSKEAGLYMGLKNN